MKSKIFQFFKLYTDLMVEMTGDESCRQLLEYAKNDPNAYLLDELPMRYNTFLDICIEARKQPNPNGYVMPDDDFMRLVALAWTHK